MQKPILVGTCKMCVDMLIFVYYRVLQRWTMRKRSDAVRKNVCKQAYVDQ